MDVYSLLYRLAAFIHDETKKARAPASNAFDKRIRIDVSILVNTRVALRLWPVAQEPATAPHSYMKTCQADLLNYRPIALSNR